MLGVLSPSTGWTRSRSRFTYAGSPMKPEASPTHVRICLHGLHIFPVKLIEMNIDAFKADTQHVTADLLHVARILSSQFSTSLKLVGVAAVTALEQHRFVPGTLLVLCTRALSSDGRPASALHPFAAAMELIVLSLYAHAGTPERSQEQTDTPFVLPGVAPRVLLGDLLYTLAYRMTVSTGHQAALMAMAQITEKMVVAATRERLGTKAHAPVPKQSEFLAASYAGCGTLAAVLGGASPEQRGLLEEFGAMCGQLRAAGGRQSSEDGITSVASEAQCIAKANEIFAPSSFRDDISKLIGFLVRSLPQPLLIA